jgi:hypothetical protein
MYASINIQTAKEGRQTVLRRNTNSQQASILKQTHDTDHSSQVYYYSLLYKDLFRTVTQPRFAHASVARTSTTRTAVFPCCLTTKPCHVYFHRQPPYGNAGSIQVSPLRNVRLTFDGSQVPEKRE